MPNQKQNALVVSQSTTYYLGRVAQRISLLLAAASTTILWASLIAIAHTHGLFENFVQNSQISTLDELNSGISNEISKLTQYAVVMSVIAIALSLLLLNIPRIRRYEKKLAIDGVVIAGFCFIFAAWCLPIYRMILSHLV